MKTTVENLSETKVKLTITLDKAELAEAEQVALTKLASNLKVPGFRKGKVPIGVAAKHVDPNLLAQETADNALSKAVATAFTSHDIRALERPQVEVGRFEPGEKLEFTAEAEIIPKIKLGDYKKLKAPKQSTVKISDEEVSEVTERIRSQLAEKKAVERAAKIGDEVIIDFLGKKGGEAFDGGSGDNQSLTLGSNSFIPGFEAGVVSHKPGEKFDLPLKFPADYHVASLAGKDVVFEVTLKEVHEIVLPELNDELAAKAGPFTSADELTEDIRRELTARAEQENQDKLRDSLVEQLIVVSSVPVPAVLRADQLKSIEQDMSQNLIYQGMTLDNWLQSKNYKSKEEWVEKEAGPLAETRVKAGLVLSELSKQAKIEASSDELKQRISALQSQYANNPEMAKRFDEAEIQREVANQLLTEKTIDHLVEVNTK